MRPLQLSTSFEVAFSSVRNQLEFRQLLLALVLLLASGFLPNLAFAGDSQWAVAINQGLVATTENNYYGQSNDGVSLDFTELSINGSYKFTPRFRLAGQSLYRRAGKGTDSVDIDYFFLDSLLVATESVNMGLNLGRFKNPTGLYNDTRDVAQTRPGIFLPQSIYPDAERDLHISSDGALFYTNVFAGSGSGILNSRMGFPE